MKVEKISPNVYKVGSTEIQMASDKLSDYQIEILGTMKTKALMLFLYKSKKVKIKSSICR